MGAQLLLILSSYRTHTHTQIKRKSLAHMILVGNQREMTTLGRGFLSFSCLLGDNSVLFRYCLVQRPFCIFVLFSSDFFYREFSFFFAFSQSLIGSFLLLLYLNLWLGTFFFFFWGQGWAFSPWVKVYGELGFWLKACRTVGHDIC